MWGTKHALNKATVMRAKILSVVPLNPLGAPAPLINKGSQDSRSVRLAEHREAEIRALFTLVSTGEARALPRSAPKKSPVLI